VKIVHLVCLLVFLVLAAAAFGQKAGVDPLSGTWTGDWGPSPEDRNQVTLELKWSNGKLTGTVNPGPNAVEIQKATFDPKTSAVHFEADAKSRRGTPIHYVIDGKVEKSTMTGSWSHDNRKGDFKIIKK
jgi:hypothetical protein